MDFAFSPKVEELRGRLLDFMDSHVYPAEQVYAEQVAAAGSPYSHPPIIEELKAEARNRGLWNLFQPNEKWGAGLTNLEYAPLAEVTGRSPIAPEALNCSAPDTGNMELLTEFGTPVQQDQWLVPLLAGEIRSCFGMTEPDVASSDATNIRSRIERDGNHYVINGRKWWTTGAMSDRCKLCIVMGVTDADTDPYHRQSMILVPLDAPGVTVLRPLSVFGYEEGGGMRRSCSRTCGSRPPTCSVRRAAASLLPRPGSARAASTTACALSVWPNGRSISCASGPSHGKHSASGWPNRGSSAT